MRFWTDIRGNVAILFTTVMPVLLVGLGMAVDYGVWVNQKQELQRIADEAALAAARELYLANTSGPQAESVAQTAAAASFASAGMTTDSSGAPSGGSDPSSSGSPSSGAQDTTFGDAVKIDVNVDLADGSVGVTVVQQGVGFFAPISIHPPLISVNAVARARGGGRVCVIALDPDGRVVYLSHEDGEGHGVVLANTFTTFMTEWIRLGCPGPEDDDLLQFQSQGGSGLDSNSEAGRAWRTLLGREP